MKVLVVNQTVRFFRGHFFLTFIFLVSIFFTKGLEMIFPRFAKISELKTYSIDQKRDIYNSFDSEDQNEQGISADPLDLLNRLKQAGSMNNATTPSDALDEALNAFDESEY